VFHSTTKPSCHVQKLNEASTKHVTKFEVLTAVLLSISSLPGYDAVTLGDRSESFHRSNAFTYRDKPSKTSALIGLLGAEE
jgi:hypothetical protein